MNPQFCLLDMDGTYQQQDFYTDHCFEWLDMTAIRQKRRLCDMRAQGLMRRKLAERESRGLTFIGSNHYHYVTLFLLEEIKQPFTLILFDHHSDALPPPTANLLSCGSWLRTAWCHLPSLQQVVLIGCDRRRSPVCLPQRNGCSLCQLDKTSFSRDDRCNRQLIQKIIGRRVYISIDKDVLARQYAETPWDQGNMTLSQLTGLISRISQIALMAGCDICGEPDVGRAGNLYAAAAAMARNNQTNQAILQTLLQTDLISPHRAG